MNNPFEQTPDPRIKKKVWNFKTILITYGVILLLVGIQMGILVWPVFQSLNDIFQVTIIMGYWALVAGGFCFIISQQIKRIYDTPMKMLSHAARKVAGGNFSVHLEPRHVGNNTDYIDATFLDFNTMVAELGSIETLKNDFVANVSHEIKTPLAIIVNYATLLQDTQLSKQERAQCTKSLLQATRRLSTLITNILKLNKLDNEQIKVDATKFDVCNQISACILAFETLWNNKNIELDIDIEERVWLYADEETLNLVWNNLFSNAIKFTPENGKISVRVFSSNDILSVSISDTGCGMDEQTLKHIFDKFYQGDSSHLQEGNGLGLALVYKIIDKMGGTISVVSALNKGSTFTVVLPIIQLPNAQNSA